MSKSKKNNKGKKTISVKRVVQIDGHKHEVSIKKTSPIEPNLNSLKNDIINAQNLPSEIKTLQVKNQDNVVAQPLVNNNAMTDQEKVKEVVNVQDGDIKPQDKEVFSLSKKNKKKKLVQNNNLSKVNHKVMLEKAIIKNDNKKVWSSKAQLKGVKVIEKDNTTKMLSSIAVMSFIIMLAVSLRFLVPGGAIMSNNQEFSSGTLINGIEVGGLKLYEASDVVASQINEQAQTFTLTLTYQDQQWEFDKDDFKVSSNIHTVIEEAYQRDQVNQSYETQVDTLSTMQEQGNNIVVSLNYIFAGLDDRIEDIAEQIEYEAEPSVLGFRPSNADNPFVITDHKLGLKVNKEQLYNDINEHFLTSSEATIEIPTLSIEPEKTQEYYESITQKISEFTTNVSDSTGSRKHNVALALDKINGLVVEPGQEISFNEVTGPHTLDNGYEVATIIYNGQFVDGVGGGVCQASTTVYNALLRAGVDVLQVSKHTLPVKYVPLALDAMVSEGVSDLRFVNNSDYDLYIVTSTTSKDVTVAIYSHELEDGITIGTKSDLVAKLPHSGDIIKPDTNQEYTDKVLFQGEQYRLTYPRDGYEAKSYLMYYKDGVLQEQKLLRHEKYYPQQGIIIEGIEEKPETLNVEEETVEQVEPSDEQSQETFLFNINNGIEILDTVPTSFCP